MNSRFLLHVFQNRQAALLFVNSTVTAIKELFRAFYLFDSHSRNVRNYVEVVNLSSSRVGRQYFQLLLLVIEVNTWVQQYFKSTGPWRAFKRIRVLLKSENACNFKFDNRTWEEKEKMCKHYKNIKQKDPARYEGN